LVAAGLLALKIPLLGLALLAAALGAPLFLKNARAKRIERLEKQIEGWLTSVARSLEAAPSLGEALEASIATCDAPMCEEIEQLDNEIRLGRPIDKALSEWSERVGSRVLTMAVATLLVGRETGGQIGEVLRSAAAALREMERLEGVVRTKTAEGKGQAWVISIVPFPLYFGVKFSDPTFFLPLEQTAMGHVLLGICAALWIGAILSARKILDVQI
jgi:tight adherence protein B